MQRRSTELAPVDYPWALAFFLFARSHLRASSARSFVRSLVSLVSFSYARQDETMHPRHWTTCRIISQRVTARAVTIPTAPIKTNGLGIICWRIILLCECLSLDSVNAVVNEDIVILKSNRYYKLIPRYERKVDIWKIISRMVIQNICGT